MTPEEARKLLDKDPLKYFIPTPTQDAFLRRDPSIWASMLTSVSRGGKSAAACVDLAWTLRGIHPFQPNYGKILVMQFAPSRRQVAEIIGRKLFKNSELLLPDAPKGVAQEPMIPEWEIKKITAIGGVPYDVEMRNGNRCLFGWSGVEDISTRVAGLRLDRAYVDEDAGNTALFDELYLRLLDAQSDKSRPGLGSFVWSNTNLRYNDAYESFVERSNAGEPGHRIFVIAPNENPAIDPNARARMRRVLSDDAASIRMDGELGAGRLTAIYAKQWYDPRHVLADDYTIGRDDNLWVGYDPGVDHPMGMMIVAINKDQPLRLNVVKCWVYRGETIEKDVDNLRDWLRGRRLTGFVYDTNLKNRDRGGGPSVLQRFKELAASRGINPLSGYYQSKKNHAPGIAMVRHYLAPSENSEMPPLLVISKPTPDNGTGLFRQQMLKYRGRESTKFTGAGGVIKKDDELSDCVRYLCMQRPSHNPEWACGLALDITTKDVDFLDSTGTIPISHASMETPVPERFDFMKRTFLTRSRDRRKRGSWRAEPV